jgi:serine/threonine protein kinase
MGIALSQNAEPIPGYRLTQMLGQGGFGEVWKCEAPGGFLKAVKFVRGNQGSNGQPNGVELEWQALNRIKAIRHPFLLSLDRVEILDGELVIVMELADRSLRDLLQEYRTAGQRGIPRPELLGFLREAAEVLDLMNLQYGLQHLDIKPDNLLLLGHHVKVADFGLVNTTQPETPSANSAERFNLFTPLYTAPERFQGSISLTSDQYSLAVVYQELLTGVCPFDGESTRQLLLQHLSKAPDLKPLPAEDRPVVARALAKEPQERFPSCTDFVQALLGGANPARNGGRVEANGPAASQAGSQPATVRVVAPGAEDQPAAGGNGERSELGERPPPPPAAAPAPLLPGYRFLDHLGRSPLGEFWKIQGPDGQERLAKFVFGYARRDAQHDEEVIQRLKALRHPLLPRLKVVPGLPGRLVLLSDLVEGTLWDHFQECRSQGLVGIPRDELLRCLRKVAEALDDLFEDHGLHHLAVHPRNVLTAQGRLQLADFGLVHLLWVPEGSPVGPLNSRYAAPELFTEPVSRHADVYSLALIYQELLTGIHPYHGQSIRRPGAARKGKQDLDPLIAPDRPLIAQALDADPEQRFTTCVELVERLEAVSPDRLNGAAEGNGDGAVLGDGAPEEPAAAALTIADLVAAVEEAASMQEYGRIRYQLQPSELRHHCTVQLLPGVARLKLEGFRQEWKAKVVRQSDQEFVCHLTFARSFWDQCRGRQPLLEIQLGLKRLGPTDAWTEVTATLRPLDCSHEAGARRLKEIGPLLLASLHAYLQPIPEARTEERLAYEQPIQVCAVAEDQAAAPPITGRSVTISHKGMRLWLPEPPATPQLALQVPFPSGPAAVRVLASVRYVNAGEKGGHEVGVQFLDEPAPDPS